MARGAMLFGDHVPPGFHYRTDFISQDEEAALVEAIRSVEFSDFQMRGVVARRRVAFFGESYNRAEALPIPDFLRPLRARAAEWAGIAPEAFAMALINEYPPGAPIGWHRDAPQYDFVAGISLLAPCRMKFRPYRSPGEGSQGRRSTTHELVLEPRSAYLMTGESRSAFEHHIPAVEAHRYSVTFRTLRENRGPRTTDSPSTSSKVQVERE